MHCAFHLTETNENGGRREKEGGVRVLHVRLCREIFKFKPKIAADVAALWLRVRGYANEKLEECSSREEGEGLGERGKEEEEEVTTRWRHV